MRKSVAFLLVLLLLATSMPAFAGSDKVDVCHKPGTEDQAQISIAGRALDAHLNHGDVQGSCSEISTKSDICSIFNYSITLGLEESLVLGPYPDTDFFAGETITMSIATIFVQDEYFGASGDGIVLWVIPPVIDNEPSAPGPVEMILPGYGIPTGTPFAVNSLDLWTPPSGKAYYFVEGSLVNHTSNPMEITFSCR